MRVTRSSGRRGTLGSSGEAPRNEITSPANGGSEEIAAMKRKRRVSGSGESSASSSAASSDAVDKSLMTPSPVASLTVGSSRILSVKRQRVMFTEIDCSKSILENLPKDIIGQIFFSGFFSTVEVSKSLVRVCKEFRSCCQLCVQAADFRGLSSSYFAIERALKYTFKNIIFLDLSFCNFCDSDMEPLCSNLSKRLVGLSLRGTEISNDSMSVLGSMANLRYLDISKSSTFQKDYIDDTGLAELSTLSKLELLNVAGTDITGNALSDCLKKCPKLKHLSIQCCGEMTWAAAQAISQCSLISLDITGSNLSRLGYVMFQPGSPCSLSLETLSCSHVPMNHTFLDIIVDGLKKLKQLDMRGVYGKAEQPILKESARGALELAVFEAHEQLRFGDTRVLDFNFS